MNSFPPSNQDDSNGADSPEKRILDLIRKQNDQTCYYHADGCDVEKLRERVKKFLEEHDPERLEDVEILVSYHRGPEHTLSDEELFKYLIDPTGADKEKLNDNPYKGAEAEEEARRARVRKRLDDFFEEFPSASGGENVDYWYELYFGGGTNILGEKYPKFSEEEIFGWLLDNIKDEVKRKKANYWITATDPTRTSPESKDPSYWDPTIPPIGLFQRLKNLIFSQWLRASKKDKPFLDDETSQFNLPEDLIPSLDDETSQFNLPEDLIKYRLKFRKSYTFPWSLPKGLGRGTPDTMVSLKQDIPDENLEKEDLEKEDVKFVRLPGGVFDMGSPMGSPPDSPAEQDSDEDQIIGGIGDDDTLFGDGSDRISGGGGSDILNPENPDSLPFEDGDDVITDLGHVSKANPQPNPTPSKRGGFFSRVLLSVLVIAIILSSAISDTEEIHDPIMPDDSEETSEVTITVMNGDKLIEDDIVITIRDSSGRAVWRSDSDAEPHLPPGDYSTEVDLTLLTRPVQIQTQDFSVYEGEIVRLEIMITTVLIPMEYVPMLVDGVASFIFASLAQTVAQSVSSRGRVGTVVSSTAFVGTFGLSMYGLSMLG